MNFTSNPDTSMAAAGDTADITADITADNSPAAELHCESPTEGSGAPGDRPFGLRLASGGQRYVVPPDKSILAVLREHGHDVPSSCESGTCGTCRTGLVSGEADHRDYCLMPDEFAQHIMVCVSRAKSRELVLDL